MPTVHAGTTLEDFQEPAAGVAGVVTAVLQESPGRNRVMGIVSGSGRGT